MKVGTSGYFPEHHDLQPYVTGHMYHTDICTEDIKPHYICITWLMTGGGGDVSVVTGDSKRLNLQQETHFYCCYDSIAKIN